MILVDTGFWVALGDRKDQFHLVAVEVMRGIGKPLITTWLVMTEVCHLLVKQVGVHAEPSFLKSWRDGAFQVFDLKEEHKHRLLQLVDKYADLPMDLADASLVILAEDLREGRILSTDRRDFRAYLWKSQHPFHNLLFDR